MGISNAVGLAAAEAHMAAAYNKPLVVCKGCSDLVVSRNKGTPI